MIILELMQESHEVILCELIARNWIKRLEKFSLRIVAFFSGLRWLAWLKFSECEILVSRAITPKKNCPRIIAPWMIALQTIAPWIIEPRIIAPEENCPPPG